MTAADLPLASAQPSRGRAARQPRRSWPVPLALLALSIIPVAAGSLRLIQLAGGPALIPADHRFAGFPLPLVIHIVGATVYLAVGAFQFVPRFRRRHLDRHRRTGRLLAVAGLMVAGSAVWMTLLYAPKAGSGELAFVLRLAFASGMAACLLLGVSSIRRGDVAAHRAWMTRAYAVGLAAGTQAFTQGIAVALLGTGGMAGDIGLGAGWVVNLAVAEWVVRRPSIAGRRNALPAQAPARSSTSS